MIKKIYQAITSPCNRNAMINVKRDAEDIVGQCEVYVTLKYRKKNALTIN